MGDGVTTRRASSLWYTVVTVLSLGLLGVVGYTYMLDSGRSRQLKGEVVALQQEVIELRSRKVELEDLLKYFDSESYAESRARLELGLVRPGEKVMVVPPTEAAASGDRLGVGRQPLPSEANVTPLKAWWAYFFGRRDGRSS